MDASNPLTGQHLAEINDAIAQLETAQQAVDKAKLAGLGSEVAGQEQVIKDSLQKLRNIKQVYFPGQ